MQPLVDEILHCIIHKAMACDAAFALKSRAGDADAKVRTKALRIGASMARMRSAFVDHFEQSRLQALPELLLNLRQPNRKR